MSGAEVKVGLPLFHELNPSECSALPGALLTTAEAKTSSVSACSTVLTGCRPTSVLHPVNCT